MLIIINLQEVKYWWLSCGEIREDWNIGHAILFESVFLYLKQQNQTKEETHWFIIPPPKPSIFKLTSFLKKNSQKFYLNYFYLQKLSGFF